MADDRLRELERRAAGGDPPARARLLAERLRAGALRLEHLRLAAYVGDPVAAAVLGDAPDTDLDDLERWAAGLFRWGKAACVRAALAVTRAALPVFERARPHDPLLRRTVGSLEDWLRCPCPRHGQRARTFADPSADERYAPGCLEAYLASVHAGQAAATADGFVHAGPGREALGYARHVGLCADYGARALGPERTRAEVRHALVAWALGLPSE